MKRPPIITLCGSTKFKKEFEEYNQAFTLKGLIVLMPGVFAHSTPVKISDEEKKQLDQLHFRKIMMSDGIFVINKNGYIGESTTNEINFAKSLDIPIYYMEKKGDK